MWLLLLACHPTVDPTSLPIDAYDPLALVDPLIGSGGSGFGIGSVNPGPLVPFGMVKVGPDTRGSAGDVDFEHYVGYYDGDDHIVGFSHNHGYGIGIADYGEVLAMPRATWDPAYTTDVGRAAPFDHAHETAAPGHYDVTLLDDGTKVELTATAHAAFHRYTFTGAANPTLVLDLGHTLGHTTVSDAHVTVAGARVTGDETMQGGYSDHFGGIQVYFCGEVDPAPSGGGAWSDPAAPVDAQTTGSGPTTGAWLTWPASTTTAHLRLALSYVDPDGACANLDAELPATADFDTVEHADEQAWRDEMGNVRVAGGTDVERRIFHTALYHAYQMPTLFSDVDGRYRGVDGQVHSADFAYYTDFSLWDTYRTLHPWLILARPDRETDMVKSLIRMAEDGGSLPRWPLGYGYTGGMVGTPENEVLAETWQKGLRDGWDANEAFDFALASATTDVAHDSRGGLSSYLSKGYVSEDESGGAAALTLEYAWSDAALAQWATALGRPEADSLAKQSLAYQNTFDPAQGFFVGRRDNGLFDTVTSTSWADDYVEGDAWQYAFMVPQDPEGLATLYGGDDKLLAALDTLWAESEADATNASLPKPYYWHGNEPDLSDAYLASLLGHPDKSAPAIRWIQGSQYSDTAAGLPGNDDGGTMSAWYLWSAIGLYPVAGTTTYAVGAPLFTRVEVDLPAGQLVIRAPGASDSADVISSATIDDQPLATGPFTPDTLDHELLFEMSAP